MPQDIVIVAAARTAVGKFGGSLAKVPAPELGATVLKALLQRSGLSSEQISEVILGQVLDEVIKRDAKKGIASLCIGGGMGVALTVER